MTGIAITVPSIDQKFPSLLEMTHALTSNTTLQPHLWLSYTVVFGL
jgi:hypothetical protein